MKYPELSPYNFVANSPIWFMDFNGKDFKPTNTFKESSFSTVLTNLMENNSSFRKSVGKFYDNSNFNIVFDINNEKVPSGKIANTKYKYWYDTDKSNKQIITAVKATIVFRNDLNNYNDLGQAILIIHEYFHTYAGLQGVGGNDSDHEIWDKYFDLMQDAVKEYGIDNNLNLSETQVYELSLYNVGSGGTVYDDYMFKLAKENNTNYGTEEQKFTERMSTLIENKADD